MARGVAERSESLQGGGKAPAVIGNFTDAEMSVEEWALLDKAAPKDTVLPIEWWSRFLSLFLGRDYTEAQAANLLRLYNEVNS